MGAVSMMGWDSVNEVWRKVLVNEDGKLIIDPSEIFENTPTAGEHGKAPDSDWASKQVGTKYWSCPGCHFEGYNPSTDNITKTGLGTLTCNADNIQIVAGVNLPQGAVIIEVCVYGNAGASSTEWVLRRNNLSSGAADIICGDLINISDTTISYATVDNSLYAYNLCTGLLYTNDIVYGAFVKYTL